MKKKNITPVAMLLMICAACTNEPMESTAGRTPITIGQIEIEAEAAISRSTSRAMTNRTLTVTASPQALVNTYTNAAGSWTNTTTAYYMEDVTNTTPPTTFQATTGTTTLCTDQSSETLFHAADYIAGPVQLDVAAKQFVTAPATPLTHQHVNVLLTLTQGTGWSSNEAFLAAIAAADIKLTTIKPYRTAATAQAIIPLANLPAQGATIATITMGSETPQPITYTLAAGTTTPAPGTRINITAQYNNQRAMTGITITVTGWTDKDMPPMTSDADRLPLTLGLTRAAGDPMTITIDGQTRNYTTAADGATLNPDANQQPVYITRGATTAAVLTYGTLSSVPGSNQTAPYIINNPAHPITGMDAGQPKMTLALAPATAQISITVTDRLRANIPVADLSVTAKALNTPATDATTGSYLFDTTNPASPAIMPASPAQPPILTTRTEPGGTAAYSNPVQCIPTTVKAGDILFTIDAGTNTNHAGKSYDVRAAADYTLEPAVNHRFTVQIDDANQATIESISIAPFTAGTDIDAATPVPQGYNVVIATKEELIAFRNRVNKGENTLRALQVADIDLAGNEWLPIGNFDGTTGYKFLGTYNGSGYTIKNITISGDRKYTGLFGYVGAGAILTGIRLEGVVIDVTKEYAGALAGYANGESNKPAVISHCTAKGTVKAKSYVGGLVGEIDYAHITHCNAQCAVTATFAGAGGLIGNTLTNSKVVACSATGTGSVTTNDSAGGLIGLNRGDVRFCFATQTVTTGSANGGFVGYNYGKIASCYTTKNTFEGGDNGTITHYHTATNTAPRYTTLTTNAGGTTNENAITVLTITREARTGKAIFPAKEVTFTATGVWSNQEFPQIIDNL